MGRRTHHTRLTLRWRGGDQPRAGVFEAGLSGVELWRALDGRKPRKLLSTRKRSITVKLLRGHRYQFFTIGVDKAGNRELAPAVADVRVQRRAELAAPRDRGAAVRRSAPSPPSAAPPRARARRARSSDAWIPSATSRMSASAS